MIPFLVRFFCYIKLCPLKPYRLAVVPVVSQVNPGLYIAFGAILGALIGSGATIYWQWILRKEKYNEVIYKEKIEAYKKLHEEIVIAMQGCMNDILSKEDKKKRLEVVSELARETAAASVVPSDKVKNLFGDISTLLTTTTHFEIGDPTLHETFKKILDYYEDFYMEIRKDLNLKAVSENTSKTFEPMMKTLKDKILKKQKPGEK